jgi:ATP-dependent RNA helicase RhlE
MLPAKRQNLLFSATFSDEIRELAAGLLHDPAYVQIARRNSVIELVRQVAIPVDRERKRELLSHLVRSGRIEQALVFTRTKHGANRLVEQLLRDGIEATAIHGNKSQGQRVRALTDFKEGRIPILVATEIAARGLDIDGLPHVLNFELPMVAEDYIHRIGRTGRAGMEGDAVSLVCVDELPLLREIERLLRHPIPQETVEGFAPDRTIRPEPIRLRSAPGIGAGRSGFGAPARGGGHAAARGGMPARPGSVGGRGRPHGAPTLGVSGPRTAVPGGFAPARRPGNRELRPTEPQANAGRPGAGGRPGPAGGRPGANGTRSGPRDGRPSPNGGRPGANAGRPSSTGHRPSPAHPGPMPRHASGASIGNRPVSAGRPERGPQRPPASQRFTPGNPGHRPSAGVMPRALPGERLARTVSDRP